MNCLNLLERELKADLADQGSSQESAREGCTIAAAGDLCGRPSDSTHNSVFIISYTRWKCIQNFIIRRCGGCRLCYYCSCAYPQGASCICGRAILHTEVYSLCQGDNQKMNSKCDLAVHTGKPRLTVLALRLCCRWHPPPRAEQRFRPTTIADAGPHDFDRCLPHDVSKPARVPEIISAAGFENYF